MHRKLPTAQTVLWAAAWQPSAGGRATLRRPHRHRTLAAQPPGYVV